MMKKILALCLAAVMCLALLPMTALAVSVPTTKLDAPIKPSAVIRGKDYSNYNRETIEITVDMPDSIQPYLSEKDNYITSAVTTLDDGRTYTLLIEVDWSVNSLNDWKCTGAPLWADGQFDRATERWINQEQTYAFIMPGKKGETTVIKALQFFNGSIEEYNAYPEFYISYRDKDGKPNEAGGRFKDGITINLRARYCLSVASGTTDPSFDFYSDWTPVFQAVRANDTTETQKPTEPTTPPTAITEKPSTWATEQVNKAIAANIVPRDLQAKYTQAATRAEFSALAVALYENVSGKVIATDKSIAFADTTDINVYKAAAIGVVSGVGDNKFSPNTGLTREQAATMLSRLADAIGKPLPKQAAAFNDNGSISSWALEAVGQIQAAGIMGGVGNNTFDPQGAYTREQSIVTIQRMYGVLQGADTSNPPPSGTGLSGKYHWTGSAGDSGKITIVFDFKGDGTVTMSQINHDRNDHTSTYQGTYKINNGKLEIDISGPAVNVVSVDSANGTITLDMPTTYNEPMVFEKAK
jgi:hypothetical protein